MCILLLCWKCFFLLLFPVFPKTLSSVVELEQLPLLLLLMTLTIRTFKLCGGGSCCCCCSSSCAGWHNVLPWFIAPYSSVSFSVTQTRYIWIYSSIVPSHVQPLLAYNLILVANVMHPRKWRVCAAPKGAAAPSAKPCVFVPLLVRVYTPGVSRYYTSVILYSTRCLDLSLRAANTIADRWTRLDRGTY